MSLSAFVSFLLQIGLTGNTASALLPQTRADLSVLEDRLTYEFGPARERRSDRDPALTITPVLVATPEAYWQESTRDFAPSVLEVLARVFPSLGALIPCAACYQNRVFITRDSRTVIQSGELSLADLARLRQDPSYRAAKSVLIVRETPGGIDTRVLAIDDGRILYSGLSDSAVTLNQAESPMHLARELDRRRRGEALGYINMDLGIYPKGLFQLKFLEQWGSRNQHLSGIVLSAYNPTGAIGATYLWILPWRRQMTLGISGYYSLQGVFGSASTDAASAFTGQVSLNYAITGSYGVFVSGDSAGVVTAGFSLLNPVLFPFLL